MKLAVILRNDKRCGDLLHLIHGARRHAPVEAVFLCSPKVSKRECERIEEAGCEVRLVNGALQLARRKQRSSVADRLLSKLPSSRWAQETRARILCHRIVSDAKAAQRRIVEFDCVIALKDKVNDFDAPIHLAARRAGLRIVIPSVAQTNLDFFTTRQRLLASPESFAGAYEREVAREFASHLLNGRLMYEPFRTRAYHRAGVLSEFPWLSGAGLSDVVCVDSQRTWDEYARFGVAPERLRLTGDIAYDALHAAHRERERVREQVLAGRPDHNRRLIVFSPPLLSEDGLLDRPAHDALMRRWLEAARMSGATVVVSLHPKAPQADYDWIAAEGFGRMAKDRLFRILPAADLLLTGFSTTVTWAILCGVTPVVTDYCGQNYATHSWSQTARIVRDDAALAAALSNPRNPSEFASDWQALSRDEVFDGQTALRYAKIFRGK